MAGQTRFTESFVSPAHSPSHPYQLYWNAADEATPTATSPRIVEQVVEMPDRKDLRRIDRPLSPAPEPTPSEIGSPGLESVWGADGEKEVYFTPNQGTSPGLGATPPKDRRICGLRRKWFWTLLVASLLVIVGLGAGLGAGLGIRHQTSPASSNAHSDYNVGGALNPQYYSKQGAFNGSGIALASQSFDSSNHGSMVMYFQHHTGDIRWQQLSRNGAWLGGSIAETVTANAKNATPLSAVSYALNGSSTWHIFYIDHNNIIRQRSNSNTTNVWVDGPINNLNLKAYDSNSVGLQACWYGSFYGDADYLHSPVPSNGATSFGSEYGMHIWYASSATTFEQLGWREGDPQWQHQETWIDRNGHAGVGCYSWGPGTVTYVMMVNLENAVEVWWKDTNSTLNSTDSHPINVWTKSSVVIPNVHPATSLGYTNFFYAQLASTHAIAGYNISWAAENSTIVTKDNFIVQGDVGLPGTHLSVSAIPNSSGGNSLIVFYQTRGDDITEFTRDIEAGQWTALDMPIPDD